MNSKIKDSNKDDDFGFYGKEALDRSVRLILNNRVFQFIIGVLLFLLSILIYSYFSLSNNLITRITLPPYGTFDVARMESDPMYYRVWGDFILNYMANFNPQNIEDNIKQGTQVFDHDVLIAKKPEFDAYYQSIKTNQISQQFLFAEADIKIALERSGSLATITYNGVATQNISNLAVRKKECFYQMRFFINDYKIYQEALTTNCLDDNTIIPKDSVESRDNQKKAELVEKVQIDEERDLDRAPNNPFDVLKTDDKSKQTESDQKDYSIQIDKDYILSGIKKENPIQEDEHEELKNQKINEEQER